VPGAPLAPSNRDEGELVLPHRRGFAQIPAWVTEAVPGVLSLWRDDWPVVTDAD
jgi:hypothetical protein